MDKLTDFTYEELTRLTVAVIKQINWYEEAIDEALKVDPSEDSARLVDEWNSKLDTMRMWHAQIINASTTRVLQEKVLMN